MSNLDEIQQQLASLQVKFEATLVQRVDKVIAELNSLEDQADPLERLEDVFRQIHSLSGSAGSFGFNRLSEQSFQLELILSEYTQKNILPDAKTIDYLNAGLQKLHSLIAKGADHEHTYETQHISINEQIKKEKRVYIVEDDPVQGDKLCVQLKHYGFKTHFFSTIAEVRLAMDQEIPDALVIDIVMSEGRFAGTELAKSVQYLLNKPIPSIFISSCKDWQSRLAAVRAGGIAYLNKPVDISNLVDHLERMTRQVQRESYRVLVVDDAFELAQHYALVLRHSGMHADVLCDPSDILEKVECFKPELILLDYYFPDISGSEIAQVLRQHQDYFSIPIIFLSTETNREIQLKTLHQGDDFLEKPVFDAHLVDIVESRIERSRALNQLMYHDGLTGLLNHITLKQRLEPELARCQRQGQPLSYVMLDLDHFKQVNDKHGHAAGDQVLKSLAQLLKERLRKSDHVGRYGGEEFAIIMPDTQVDMACNIIDDIRKRFSQLSYHDSDEQEFSCSFSAGISCASAFEKENLLIEAADEALYLAKEKGRNLIIVRKECQ